MEILTRRLILSCAIVTGQKGAPATTREIANVAGVPIRAARRRMVGIAKRHPRLVSRTKSGGQNQFRILRGEAVDRLATLEASVTERAVDTIHRLASTFGPMSGSEIQAILGKTGQNSTVAHLLTNHIRKTATPKVRVVKGRDGVTRFMPVRAASESGMGASRTADGSARRTSYVKRGRPATPGHTLRLGQILVESGGLSVPRAAQEVGISAPTLRAHLKAS